MTESGFFLGFGGKTDANVSKQLVTQVTLT